jgi:acyl-CoA oxidase
VRVPKRNLLTGGHSRLDDDGAFHSSVRSRRERFLQAIDRVQLGRLCLTGGAIAVARAAAWVAIRYGQQRMTFAPGRADVPILRYRNVQRDVFGALADAFALTVAMARARRLYRASAGGASPALSRTLATFKAVATYACADAVAVCRERCGAAGMFDENRLLGFWTQIQGLITAEGDNQIVLLKAARQMLAREHYEPPEILEQPQPARRSLADPAFQAALLRQRERGQLAALDAGVAEALARGDDLFDAWNDHVNPALELARSHGVRFVFEEFDAAVERVAEVSARRVLRQLCSLFALREIARSSGWLLAEGALTPAQVKALPRTLDDHCAALLPYAGELTACWGLSNELLRVPIAGADYVAAYDAKARRGAAAR